VGHCYLLSRSTTAIAILEAALKQMHVVAFICALLHGNMNHLPFTSVFFAGRISRLPSCCVCLRLARAGAGACQYRRTGSCVRPYGRASIWDLGLHIETPYKI
jgi:hypothetical protein